MTTKTFFSILNLFWPNVTVMLLAFLKGYVLLFNEMKTGKKTNPGLKEQLPSVWSQKNKFLLFLGENFLKKLTFYVRIFV